MFNIRRKQKYFKILILVLKYMRNMNKFYAILAQVENIVRLE